AAPAIADGPATAFVRPHEFAAAPAGSAGLPVTLRRVQRTGALIAMEATTQDGSIVEAALQAVPPGLSPGSALVLVPLAVRAYSA
uniref:hypothetical protein n=1 Tax=Sandarakinorhabdus sp. TaxID=1916663 RepID=UPI00286E275F